MREREDAEDGYMDSWHPSHVVKTSSHESSRVIPTFCKDGIRRSLISSTEPPQSVPGLS